MLRFFLCKIYTHKHVVLLYLRNKTVLLLKIDKKKNNNNKNFLFYKKL